MSHELLKRLRITPLYEPDREAMEFIDSHNYDELEKEIANALESHCQTKNASSITDAIAWSKMLQTNISLAEITAKCIGMERGLRIGRESGENLIEGAQQFADGFIRQHASLFEDAEEPED